MHNISRRETLHQSMYILHPLHSTSNTPPRLDFDIVLIHGLLGSVFKTWRQSDVMKTSRDYTECWPKSWLPADFGNCRILAVNYQTFLSNWNWNSSCGRAYTLKEQSVQLAQELRSAHVGERPIVYITHSQGGLLLKEMLVQIAESEMHQNGEQKLLDRTKGIVFYSTPHKGSEMAVWSPKMQRIISLSDQVQELRKGCFYLCSHKIYPYFMLIF